MEKDLVKIPRKEHDRLRKIESSFDALQKVFFAIAFTEPSTKNTTTILREMKATKTYSSAFLRSIEQGLKDSSYFNR